MDMIETYRLVAGLTGIAFLALSMVSKTRKQILISNIIGCVIVCSSLYLSEIYMAATVSCVAALGGIFQLLTNGKESEQAKYKRIAISMIAIMIGAALLYETPQDILLIIAFSSCRIGECFTKGVHVQFGYSLSISLWLNFLASSENYVLYGGYVVLSCIVFYKLIERVYAEYSPNLKSYAPIRV